MASSEKTKLNIINYSMKDYEYVLEQGDFDGYYIFTLTKRLDFTSDHTIKVTIEFPTVIDGDGKQYTKDVNENLLYNDENNDRASKFIKKRAREFIEKLIHHNSTKKGGQKRKQRKTRKNKK